ncbi:MAG: hypothetical protein IPM21_12090 [Acidobacteria bacterium]|nr:hypothetical protein [Acidobacteriota bacterium]
MVTAGDPPLMCLAFLDGMPILARPEHFRTELRAGVRPAKRKSLAFGRLGWPACFRAWGIHLRRKSLGRTRPSRSVLQDVRKPSNPLLRDHTKDRDP